MDNPIGSPKLEDLAKGKKNIVIISSDHTRPVPSKIITPILLRRIRSVQSVLSSDYTSGNQPASQRDDLEYIASSNLSYAFNAHVGVNLAFEFDAGRNGLDGVANPSTRSFDRNLIFLGLLVKF